MDFINGARRDRDELFSMLPDDDLLYMCFKHFASDCSDEDRNRMFTFIHNKYKLLSKSFNFQDFS